MNGQPNHMKTQKIRRALLLAVTLLMPGATLLAQEAAAAENKIPQFGGTVYTNPVFIALVISALLLMVLIMVLGDIVKSSLHHQREMLKEKNNGGGKTMMMIALLIAIPAFSFAQDAAAPAAAAAAAEPAQQVIPQFTDNWWGLDGFTFWTLVLFNLFEAVIAFFFIGQIKTLLGNSSKAKEMAAKPVVSFMEKFNASVAIEDEKDILLDHDYDGIKELDNDLPPWWKYGFYFTIVAAVIYMFNYHIFKTGALQIDELKAELAQADIQMKEYKAKHANLIDENNVTLLTEAADIEEGKGVFASKDCKACHGANGEGTSIAPNLTDDYWIHGGSIQDVFKSIKYGWTEKGMKAWGQELSPRQMHVLASYVKSLRGSNPANAKAPEGTIYTEEGATATVVPDSTATAPVADSAAVK